ncbi:hypothetical protein BgiMline_003958, partial [Biomphalaria glabrata]
QCEVTQLNPVQSSPMTVKIHELHLVQYSQVQWEVAQLNPLQSSPVGSRPVESITVKSSGKSPS